MTEGWRDLRNTDRDLAFCLLFAPASHRGLLADRLLLAHESESAIRVASEPLLAAIRLQWWCDALETRRHENVPLMMRLLSHIDSGQLSVEDLNTQLAFWQDRLQRETECGGGCWRDFFRHLVSREELEEAAGVIGTALVEPSHVAAIQNRHLESLAGGDARWIGMLGLLLRYRCSVPTGDAEPMLAWRMLGWRLGFRRPQAQPTSD
ncbi:MAG: hypothetical protein VXX27_07320 [Pseudomonadota bacterium]|nr:hypothetical protein [Pseudomonadota bacterium]